MRHIIYGAGAVGGAIGGRLFEHGREVVLIARGDHLAAIRQHGLRLISPEDEATLRVPVVGHPSEITFRPDDTVFLTMKTQDTAAALDHLATAAGTGVLVICAQNGVENERLACRRFERVYGMLVILPATFLEPGVVEAGSAPVTGILDAGRFPSGTDDLIAGVCDDLESAGFSAHPDTAIMRWKYGKLLQNLNNAFQAVCGLDARADISRRAVAEAQACLRAAGIEFATAVEMRERRELTPGFRPGARLHGGSSTWQSLARGTGSTEVDYLNGEIALLGRLYGVPTPVNSALQRAANRLARDRLPPGSVTIAELEREAAGLD